MTAQAPINIAALAKQAGVPADEPALQEFARLVATECVRIAEWLPLEAHLSWLPDHHVRAVTDDVSGRIMAAFDIGDVAPNSGWITRFGAAMLSIEPRFAVTDGEDSARIAWIDRFAARLHELDPSKGLTELEAIAEQVVQDGRPWLSYEPGRAATFWHAEQRAREDQSSEP